MKNLLRNSKLLSDHLSTEPLLSAAGDTLGGMVIVKGGKWTSKHKHHNSFKF